MLFSPLSYPALSQVLSPHFHLSIKAVGLTALACTSNSTKEEVMRYMEMLATGSSPAILYATPEKISKSKSFLNKLEVCFRRGSLKRIVIDEAHCCSEWGHDFRTDYNALHILKTQFSNVPLLCLTATAIPKVVTEVCKTLNIVGCEVFRCPIHRPELRYSVVPKHVNDKVVVEDIVRFIATSHHNSSGIVYCYTRKDCETVAAELSLQGIQASPYHADMSSEERLQVQQFWQAGRYQVVVATVAFGMGINKMNVRFVIHHTLSKSIEGFYQESGRAGRDGLAADCVIYYRSSDVIRLSTRVIADRSGLGKLYSSANFCENRSSCRRDSAAWHLFWRLIQPQRMFEIV